jgi:hypothetical protein
MYVQKTTTIEDPIQFAGIVISAAVNGSIKTVDVITSDEGTRFCDFTDNILNQYVFHAGGHPSFVERILIVFLQDGKTEVHLNNFDYTIATKSKVNKKMGDSVTVEDIVGIDCVKFDDINIPDDAGVILQLSWMGKKCAFYDVTPIALKGKETQKGTTYEKKRHVCIEKTAGIMMSHIAFIELFNETLGTLVN